MRDEVVSLENLYSLAEASVVIVDWVRRYNEERPHSSLD
jgi:transposase InsO family protein